MNVMHVETSIERPEPADWRADVDATLMRMQLSIERLRVHLARAELQRLQEALELERALRRRGLFGRR